MMALIAYAEWNEDGALASEGVSAVG